MSVIKVLELMSDSDKSWDDAVKRAVARASASVKNVRSAWVQDQSVVVEKGQIRTWRVTVKVSFEVMSGMDDDDNGKKNKKK